MIDSPPSLAPSGRPGAVLLRLIGGFKILKGLALIAAAVSVFHLIHKNIADVIVEWSRRLHIAPGYLFVERLVHRVQSVTERQLVLLAVVLLIYSAMFLIEGTGLLMMKHWAEWMTVITTSGLIPFEMYEMIHRPSRFKAITMLLNVAIALYLAERVRREAAERRRRRENTDAAS
ncbi:MAG: DUF2127 domain-containing protein [Tepidisphaeraceae bacterium]|jgi:uncharacterized membrane protein (DUF2068 family)